MWKRIVLYAILLYISLSVSFIALLINRFVFINFVPQIFTDYPFWLCLGMMLGFRLCQHTTSKILNSNR